jgi:hypothetical protein
MNYVERGGKKIAVETLDTGAPVQKRKPFTANFVKLPHFWIERLRDARKVSTITLAHAILREAFKRQHVGGEIVLSAETTGLSQRHVRKRAVKELRELGLIKTEQNGNQATRVTSLISTPEEEKKRRREEGPGGSQTTRGGVSNDTRRGPKRHAAGSQTTRGTSRSVTTNDRRRALRRHAPSTRTARGVPRGRKRDAA